METVADTAQRLLYNGNALLKHFMYFDCYIVDYKPDVAQSVHAFNSRYDPTLLGCTFFTPKVFCMR